VKTQHEAGNVCSSEMLVDSHQTTWRYILEIRMFVFYIVYCVINVLLSKVGYLLNFI
jgi:hypothetical protein